MFRLLKQQEQQPLPFYLFHNLFTISNAKNLQEIHHPSKEVSLNLQVTHPFGTLATRKCRKQRVANTPVFIGDRNGLRRWKMHRIDDVYQLAHFSSQQMLV
jgi:hypothetical protein